MTNIAYTTRNQFDCYVLTQISKTVSNIRNALLPALISLHQTAYLKDRFIGKSG